MSERDQPGDGPKQADYEVGYGHPPKQRQFKKGHSGNPRGRPRKTAVAKFDPVFDAFFGDIVLSEALRTVTVRENGQAVELPTLVAIIRALNVSAIKGNPKAQAASIDLAKSVQLGVVNGRRKFYEVTVAYKKWCRQQMADYEKAGVPHPEFVPHPDDIVIDEQTFEVRFNGPETEDQQAEWKTMRARKSELDRLRATFEAAGLHNPESKPEIELQIRQVDDSWRAIDTWFPDEQTRRRPGFNLQEWRQDHSVPKARTRRKSPRPQP